ncbi:MAG: NADP-dependent phosphogluconate dehydrogenase [Bacteroidota bacterium]|nr:NADP-dependent phosphogluconate dehydrogenase [Bacteroidota bacterium]MDP4190948.1 NADP-dependent phosphogluconate dehydrogenase [Bacteroidota bacterium]MDP4195367.1 NADP-dependent phosphogluconate dehydrogenase [Bacteroidota bacterium]
MNNEGYDIAMIGLGTMGRNLVLNMGDKGFSVSGFDREIDKVNMLKDESGQRNILPVRSVEELVKSLKKPRLVMMLVPAGAPVDAVISDVLPYLEKGDVIIDGGNSHFTDTDRRVTELAKKEMNFLGVGISGGEKGARFGPSIMPGGSKEGYESVRKIFEAVAAKVEDKPCVAYMGPGSAGHYVKMVHNGIEYAVIQLIAETYHLLKQGFNLDEDELHDIFSKWNSQKDLQSYLIEITSRIFIQNDEQTKKRLINLIKDSAKQKGTGKWTSQDAMDLQVPVPTIDSAVMMRDLSVYKNEREEVKNKVSGPDGKNIKLGKDEFIKKLGNALYFGMVTSYAQGMMLLKSASKQYKYDIQLDTVASIWRGGCIIRAGMLSQICSAFKNNNELNNLLLDDYFAQELSRRQSDVRDVIKTAIDAGIPVAAMMASLSYYDGYRSKWLPANLIQAQRDYFGSHTYERIDREGVFHTQWNEEE